MPCIDGATFGGDLGLSVYRTFLTTSFAKVGNTYRFYRNFLLWILGGSI